MYSLFVFSFMVGQLLKLPFGSFGSITILDLFLGVFCIVCALKTRVKLSQFPFFYKLGFGFSFLCLITLIFSPLNLNPTEKLISLSYLVRFIIFLFSGLFIYLNFFGLKKNTGKVLIYSGIGVAILGILQFIFIPDLYFLENLGWDPHLYRTVSTFLDPNFAGAFFVLTLILLCLINPFSKKLFLVLFAVVFFALLTTFSRGSYLMFTVSFITIALLNRSLKTFFLTLILLGILVGGFLFYQQIVATPKNIDRESSAQQRIDSWQQGLVIFTQNPILGVGFNSYRFALKQYHLAPEIQIASHGGSTNDSSLLFIAATTGIVGLIFYLIFLLSIFKTALENFRQQNIWGLVVFSGLLGLIAQSFFANTLFYPPLLAWLFFSTAQLSERSS